MRVSLIQLRIDETEPVDTRIDRAVGMIRDCNADLVILPELWNSGAFDVETARRVAEPLDGPLVSSLSAVARDRGIWLHGGSFTELADDGRHFNTAVLFSPDGSLAATYRKIHLFGFSEGETTLMTAGEEIVVVDSPLGRTALATCYDLRFPELFRRFVDAGATAVLLTSGWPSPRISHWQVLTRARAIENQLLVVACNEVGVHGGMTLGGHSVVVAADGEVVAEASADETVISADVDVSRAAAWRAAFPVLDDRRV